MNSLELLESILERLEDCPRNLARVELQTFRKILESDLAFMAVLRDIVTKNEEALGAKVANVVNSPNDSTWTSLDFASTPELRAVVGYQACTILLDGYLNPSDFNSKIENLGLCYAAQQNPYTDPSVHSVTIRVFSKIFLGPLVSYLRGGIDLDNRILQLLGRYKQRCEWFTDQDEIETEMNIGGNLESRLRKDLLMYLFDNGIEFSLESEEPSGRSRVDILPVVQNWGLLPIEVKIFDGKGRGRSYIAKGLLQAGDYARSFHKQNAYYFIYNLAEDVMVNFPGVGIGPNIVKVALDSVGVYTVVADLNRNLPSSQAHKLKTVDIPPPT